MQARLDAARDEPGTPERPAGRVSGSGSVSLHDQVERIYEETRGDLYVYLLCFRLPPALAEDLTQESFVSLYRALAKGQTIETVRPWLYRVARNLALKARARESAFLAIEPDFDRSADGDAKNPEQALIEKQRLVRLNAAVSGLSPQQRECLHLRAAGLRYREIAEAIGISSSAVSEFLRRGINKLRGALNE